MWYNVTMTNNNHSTTDSNGMPSATGQPYAASEKEFVTPVPNSKTEDSSTAEEIGKQSPCWDGYVQRGMKPGRNGTQVPNCVPSKKADSMDKADTPEGYHRMPDGNLMADWIPHEGDMVTGMTSEGPVVGLVEHVMLEGGVYGEGTEYAVVSNPENPAMAVRVYEQDGDTYYATAYSIGMIASDATILTDLNMGSEDDEEKFLKADSYSPTSGMKSAAKRALKWKSDGKATGAGTPVGWGRATDIVAGRSMSLSVVKRMYSFFSRHEVDKKGKDFSNTSNPSNGRIMWDAWGGDAGFSWSRAIVDRMRDKSMFADFGKDYTKATRMSDIFKADSVRVGQMVSWNSSGGTARGKVKRIITSGAYKVPGTDVTVSGTKEDPAAVITLYRNGKETDTIVAHKVKTLRAS